MSRGLGDVYKRQEPPGAEAVVDDLEHPRPGDAAPPWLTRREDDADVHVARRREQGVGERVGHDVTVGVTDQAVGVIDRDGSEHEWYARAEAMGVDARADPDTDDAHAIGS